MRHTYRCMIDHEPAPGARVALSDVDRHHLVRVARRRVGDPIEVIDPTGTVWPAVLVQTAPAALAELAPVPRPRARRVPVTLMQGLCDWGRLDTIVEKCTELGVARIAVFAGARSRRVPEPEAWERRRARLVRVAAAAARQSGQGTLPHIDGLLDSGQLAAELAGTRALVLDPRAELAFTAALAQTADWDALTLVIGPEAGFDPAELAALRTAGAGLCHLGATTLRAETAAIAAVSIGIAVTGGLSVPPAPEPTEEGPASE